MSSPTDLTARARIRDAALDLFAERGIGPATIRDIAQAAGVSSGLLRHHFGSKEGLRDACDEFAMARLGLLREQMLAGEKKAIIGSLHPEAFRLQGYLVRSLMDGSGSAEAMFARMVESGEEWLAGTPIKSADPTAYAAVLVAMQMGMFLMRDQLSRTLGADVREPHGNARMLRAAVEIFRQPLLSDEQAAMTYEALNRLVADEGER